MPSEDLSFEYRNPAELARQVIGQLGQAWTGLSPENQTETGKLLAQVRTELVQAAGDPTADERSAVMHAGMKRAEALKRFLYACEVSTALPHDIRTEIGSAHRQTSRGAPELSKDVAREIVASIDMVWSPTPAVGSSPGSPTADTFSDPLGRARRLTGWFNRYWEVISLEVEAAVTQALFDLGIGLQYAQDDDEREAVALDFLRTIKAFAPAYDLVANSDIYRSLSGGSGAGERTSNANKILDNLGKHPIVGPALQDGNRSTSSAPPSDPALESFSAGPSVTLAKSIATIPPDTNVLLHTFVDFPAEVSVFDNNIPLVVQFTIEQRATSRVQDVFNTEFSTPEEVKQVLVVCNAEGFKENTGVTTRLMEVYATRDSQPAVFLLTPEENVEAGLKRISLDFFYCGVLALSSAFEVEIKSRPPVQRDSPVAFKPLIVGQGPERTFQVMGALVLEKPVVETPDLVLRVAMSADERELRFTLDSPNNRFGYRQTYVGRVTLPERKSPGEFLESYFLQLNDMAGSSIERRTPDQTKANQREIDKIGWNLYRDLFPPELKAEWPIIQKARAGQNSLSLLILSDEPWFPWEMVKAPDENGDPAAGSFLCEQFRLSRWVAGRRLPDAIALTSALLIAPNSNLASVKKEKAYFSELARTQQAVKVNDKTLERAAEVEDALANQTARLYHFACHGDFESDNPNDSRLLLLDSALRPSDIIGPTQVGIEKGRPLVFLNACTSAGADVSLIGIGGWSKRFVDAGVTAFIGSLWEVNDTLAADFAEAFYNQVIITKASLGQAFHEARRIIKEKDPGNPTWLAYVLYAHPNGKVEIGT